MITPDASPEEVAAIIAAVSAYRNAASFGAAGDDTLHEWVRAARLQSRRSGLHRGPWRLSGRIGRRSRA